MSDCPQVGSGGSHSESYHEDEPCEWCGERSVSSQIAIRKGQIQTILETQKYHKAAGPDFQRMIEAELKYYRAEIQRLERLL